MKGDIFFPSTFSPTPPLPISKHQHDSPPSSPSSTPPSTPSYSSSPSSLSSSFSSPTSAFSSPVSHQYLSSSVPNTHHSPFYCHSPPTSPCSTPPPMAATLFFPPPAMSSTPFPDRRIEDDQDDQEDVEVEEVEVQDSPIPRGCHRHLRMHDSDSEDDDDREGKPDEDVVDHRTVVDHDGEELEVEQDVLVVEEGVETQDDNHHDIHDTETSVVGAGVAAIGLEAPMIFRRVTLKPRRTLSLSPTPGKFS